MKRILFFFCALATIHPAVPAPLSLLLGILFALVIGNPVLDFTKRWTSPLMQFSIIGLGAGMNLIEVSRVGAQGFGYTAIGIALTFFVGLSLGKIFGIDREISVLLTSGTAICGGSAIAAVSSTIGAKHHNTSVALATVFCLNAVALFIFPPIGHHFGLSETAFGIWSGLAIHDTSSVVGAAIQYGREAVQIATPVKLARAIWIVPMCFAIGLKWHKKEKAKRPWFILGFLLAAALVTYIPTLQPLGGHVAEFTRRTLVVTLFFIGSGLTRETLRAVGARPFAQGILLWAVVSSATLLAIRSNWIH